jgi:hypothetical protein
MSNIKKFSSRKEVTEFLATKGIDTSNWSEEKWLQLNKGQAEIHMMALAECIWDAVNESIPRQLKAGEWHVPFTDKFESYSDKEDGSDFDVNDIKISTALCARTSYTVVGDEKEIDHKKMIELHDRLISQNPPHSSPLEHCAKAMSDYEWESFLKGKTIYEKKLDFNKVYSNGIKGWCRNYRGFIQYRHLIENGGNL